ncbi:MAG: VCBS repeat-containing protein [Planctomycetes bacterium]|nr:VCBS repeat-containing protein [Planctomycetota bacterium]
MKRRLCLAVSGVAAIGAIAGAVISGCRGDYGVAPAGGGGAGAITDFLTSGRTLSFFQAIQVDPRSEDSAGPQFVVAEDVNADGLMDLVSAWNQSQPVQVHLQRRNAAGAVSFETVTLAGNIPVVAVAGLAITDFDQDDALDVAVLVKETLLEGPGCLDSAVAPDGLSGLILVYFGPADHDATNQALAWEEVDIGAAFLQGTGDSATAPDVGGYTGMAVGDMDGDSDMDIVAALNSDCGTEGTFAAVVFTNGGPGPARDGTWAALAIPDSFPKGTALKGVALGDIDRDGDLDVVAAYPEAQTMNVRWYRNPAVDVPDDFHISDGQWQTGTVAQIATGADTVKLADMDRDGRLDVLVRSTNGRVLQWLKGPEGATTAPVRAVPWQVYTLAEYVERTPEATALGDLTGDGQVEAIATAQGGLSWFDSQSAPTLYDQWTENLIIDDQPADTGDNDPATTDPNVAPEEVGNSTSMNSLVVVDLDGDGLNDVVVTLDRSGLSGLTNDALVWFRNTR